MEIYSKASLASYRGKLLAVQFGRVENEVIGNESVVIGPAHDWEC
jgi:hypothetical protein